MRILYTFGYFLDESGGHVIHALKLCEAIRRAGHDVRMIAPVHREADEAKAPPNWVIAVTPQTGRLGLARRLRDVVKEQVRQWNPDVAYVRPVLKDALAVRWLQRSGLPTFLEINTLTASEHAGTGDLARSVAAALVERAELRRTTGVVCITEEIARAVGRIAGADRPVEVTGNGFDADEVQLATFDAAARDSLQTPKDAKVLIFAGSLQTWAGLDLLLPILAEVPDAYLWLVADGPERDELLRKARDRGVDSRLRWAGWIRQAELQTYFAAADLAVGPLALHRNGMTEAQPMKVRTYLGAGLPVLLGYSDPRVSRDVPWVRIADATSPADMRRAVEELLALPTRDSALRGEIRRFAVANLSWEVIASETIRFIQECVSMD